MLVSIVIPIYNEEKILRSVIERLTRELAHDFSYEYEILLCENGSRDRTFALAQELAQQFSQVRAFTAGEPNYGKALKTGMCEARGEYVIGDEIDIADVDFYRRSLRELEVTQSAMVIGSKRLAGSEDKRPLLRRIATACITGLLKLVFGLKVSDTHGLKAMRRSQVLPVVLSCVTEKDLFASELVIRAERAQLSIREIPIVIVENRKTPISIVKRIPNVLKNIVRLWFAMQEKSWHAYLLIGTVLAFLLFAFYGMPDSPPPWFDEGVNLGIAKTFVQHGVYSLQLAPNQFVTNRSLMITTNYPVLAPIILMFWLFGVGLLQTKIVMVCFLALLLIAAYTLMSRLYSTIAARWGLALLVSFLPLYGNGLSGGLGEVPGLFYLLAGLLVLQSAKKPRSIFYAGLLFGLMAATKVFYLTYLLPIVCGECWYAYTIEKRIPWKRWVWLGAGILIPLVLWAYTLFPTWGAVSTALRYYANPYHVDHTVFANLKRFVTESTPVHFTLLCFAYVAYRWQQRKKITWGEVESIIVGCILVTLIVYARGAGWYRYFFPAHLLMIMLAPGALYGLLESAKHPRLKKCGATAILGVLLCIQTMQLVLHRSASEYYYPDTRHDAAQIDEYLSHASDIVIVNKPEMWFLMQNAIAKQYLQINPYASVGEDFFTTGKFPRYLITGNPDTDPWLTEHTRTFTAAYRLAKRFGRYWVFEYRMK